MTMTEYFAIRKLRKNLRQKLRTEQAHLAERLIEDAGNYEPRRRAHLRNEIEHSIKHIEEFKRKLRALGGYK